MRCHQSRIVPKAYVYIEFARFFEHSAHSCSLRSIPFTYILIEFRRPGKHSVHARNSRSFPIWNVTVKYRFSAKAYIVRVPSSHICYPWGVPLRHHAIIRRLCSPRTAQPIFRRFCQAICDCVVKDCICYEASAFDACTWIGRTAVRVRAGVFISVCECVLKHEVHIRHRWSVPRVDIFIKHDSISEHLLHI